MVKWLSEETLQIAEKRKEAKGKGEKKRYTHLNAEFQRIARRDKKTFLSDQCKEIEENNRIGKPRDSFKKIRDTKGTSASFSPLFSMYNILSLSLSKSFADAVTLDTLDPTRAGPWQISSRKLEIPREHFIQRWAQ